MVAHVVGACGANFLQRFGRGASQFGLVLVLQALEQKLQNGLQEVRVNVDPVGEFANKNRRCVQDLDAYTGITSALRLNVVWSGKTMCHFL